jgi:hypothetical protein
MLLVTLVATLFSNIGCLEEPIPHKIKPNDYNRLSVGKKRDHPESGSVGVAVNEIR